MDPYNRGGYDPEEHHRHQGYHHRPPPPSRPMDDYCEEGFEPGREGFRGGGEGFGPGGGDFPPPPAPARYPQEGGHHHYSDFNPFHHSHKVPDAAADDAECEDYGSSRKGSEAAVDLPQGQLVRIFCKENGGFNLAVERGIVMMSAANAEDEGQQWIKDVSYGMRVKDNYGSAAFSLVNKKSKKVLKHAKETGQQVLLMDYRPSIKDDDILWTESQDFGEGFKTVRAASNTLLNLTIFEGDKRIRNGSAVVLDTWHKGGHQLWKIFPL